MRTSTRPGSPWRLRLVALVALSMTACAASVDGHSQTTATTGPTATTTPLPPLPPLPATRVWVQPLSTNTTGSPQLWLSLRGGPPRQLTSLTWSSSDPQLTSGYWLGMPVLSPDGAHVAFSRGFGQGDLYQTAGSIYVADTTSGSAVQVPISGGLVNNRLYAWQDNGNLITTTHSNALERYILASQSNVALANTPAINGFGQFDDLEVRGTTLWFDVTQTADGIGQTTLYAYDLTSSTALRHVSLGTTVDGLPNLPPNTHWQGWDVSPDGQHVVYQVTGTSGSGFDTRVSSSAIWYANADLSGSSRILRYLSTHNVVHLALSPDGNWVAVTDASPTPNVVSGSVHSAGDQNDSTFHSYTPDGVDQPAWESDSASFYRSIRLRASAFRHGGESRRAGLERMCYNLAVRFVL